MRRPCGAGPEEEMRRLTSAFPQDCLKLSALEQPDRQTAACGTISSVSGKRRVSAVSLCRPVQRNPTWSERGPVQRSCFCRSSLCVGSSVELVFRHQLFVFRGVVRLSPFTITHRAFSMLLPQAATLSMTNFPVPLGHSIAKQNSMTSCPFPCG